jgi:hypothetical protein
MENWGETWIWKFEEDFEEVEFEITVEPRFYANFFRFLQQENLQN